MRGDIINHLERTLDVGCRMAQELQDAIDAGEQEGCDMTATRALLDEWESVYGDITNNKRTAA